MRARIPPEHALTLELLPFSIAEEPRDTLAHRTIKELHMLAVRADRRIARLRVLLRKQRRLDASRRGRGYSARAGKIQTLGDRLRVETLFDWRSADILPALRRTPEPGHDGLAHRRAHHPRPGSGRLGVALHRAAQRSFPRLTGCYDLAHQKGI